MRNRHQFFPSSILFTLSLTILLLDDGLSKPVYVPQFLAGGTGRNIRHLPCVSRRTGETGVCMFAFTCAKANGTHLGTCIDRFYFGSCCKIDDIPEIPLANSNNLEDTNDIPGNVDRPQVIPKRPLTSTTLSTSSSTGTTITATSPQIKLVSSTTPRPIPSTVTRFPPRNATSTTTSKPPKPEALPITTTTSTRPPSKTNPPSTFSTTNKIFSTRRPITTSTSPPTRTNPPTSTLLTTKKTYTTKRPSVATTSAPPKTNVPTSTVTTKKPYTHKRPIASTLTPSKINSPSSTLLTTKKTYTTKRPSTTTTSAPPKTDAPTSTLSTTRKPFPTKRPVVAPSLSPVKLNTPGSTLSTDKIVTTKKPIMSSSTVTTASTPASTSTTTLGTSTNSTSSTKPSSTKPSSTSSTTTSAITNATHASSASTPVSTTPSTTTSTSTKSPTTTEETVYFELLSTVATFTSPDYEDNMKPINMTHHYDGKPSTPEVTKPMSTAAPTSSKTNPPTSTVSTTSKRPITSSSPTTVTTSSTPAMSSSSTTTTTTTTTTAGTSSSSSTFVSSSSTTISTTPSTTSTTTERPTTTEGTTYVELLSTVATITTSPDYEDEVKPVNMTSYQDVCGRRLFPEPRIVGGNGSSFGKWPWQISLRQWRTSTYLHKCGAALLNENWAITAAHCVHNVSPSDLLLRFGEHDLGNKEEPYGHQERRVQIVATHPQFDPRTFEYDLALMRFYEPVLNFQPNMLPVCVPEDDDDYEGDTAYVTGWGRLYEDGPLPSVLQEVAVPVINNTACEEMYRNAGYIEHIPHIFICAGWQRGGFDSCEGDSGGPLVVQRKRDKRWTLVGVISWGIGCAEPNQPGVYTRISEFREWINLILKH